MTRTRHRSSTPSRRTVIKSAAAVCGVTGTGLGAIALTSQPARAALTVSSFTVTDATETLAPGEAVRDVVLDVQLAYEFDSSHPLDAVSFDVDIRNGTGDAHPLASQDVGSPPQTETGTVTLSGSLLDTPAFTAANFDVAEGSTIAIDLGVEARMELVRDGEVVGIADATDTGRIVVSKEALTVAAQVGGEAVPSVTVGTETASP